MSQKSMKKLRRALKFKPANERKYLVTKFTNGSRTFKSVDDRIEYQKAKKGE